jgi:hypothetical protein
MKCTLKTIIKTKLITSIAFSSISEAKVASGHMLDNWGVGIAKTNSDNSLVVNMRHNTHEGVFTSEIFSSEEEANTAQEIMLRDWNIITEIHHEVEQKDEFTNFDY